MNKAARQPPNKRGCKKPTQKMPLDPASTPTTTLMTPSTNATSSYKKTSPSANTQPRTHVNALKMQKDGVFDEGYDSDGYILAHTEEQILLK